MYKYIYMYVYAHTCISFIYYSDISRLLKSNKTLIFIGTFSYVFHLFHNIQYIDKHGVEKIPMDIVVLSCNAFL